MKKIIILCVYVLTSFGFATEGQLREVDVNRVMEQFFSIHVEYDKMNPQVMKRAFRLYIERFDPDRVYLLQREVLSYIDMSDAQARKAIERFNRKDYSDFQKLNALIQKSITRHRFIRENIQNKIIKGDYTERTVNPSYSSYARSEKELADRVEEKMTIFYQIQDQRWDLSTLSRKEKALNLFEKKITRNESFYLFENGNKKPFSKAEREHYFTLHMLKALSKSLDTHTAFFSEEEAYQMRSSLQKQFQGVGVVLTEGIDGVVITDVIKGGPAQESGKVEVNDVVVEIDGQSVRELAFEDVMVLMKKKNGLHIQLGLMRYNKSKNPQFYRVVLERKPIEMEEDRISVSYEPYEGGIVATITLRSFYENDEGVSAERDIKKAIRKLEKEGRILGLVLDLRENAGGFLSQAVKVAGLFIKSGVVVISKYANNEIHYLRTLDGQTAYNGPMVVLTSKLSASAAEIVGQALQDYGVALVVGDSRTFGKGSIQYQTVTDENAEFYFKVTVGKYYTASGRTTQLEGVKADIVVPSIYSPYLIGEKYLEYPLTNDKVKPAFKDSLSDLDPKAKRVFEKYYLPHVQRVVTIWQRMLPQLKKNSIERIKTNPQFQAYLQKLKLIEAKINGVDVPIDINSIDYGNQDLQVIEALNIVKDMIQIEAIEREEKGIARQASSW